MERLPEPFNMVEVEIRVKDKTPFVVVALQEATRMNALLVGGSPPSCFCDSAAGPRLPCSVHITSLA